MKATEDVEKQFFSITDFKHTAQQLKKPCLVVATITKMSYKDTPQKNHKTIWSCQSIVSTTHLTYFGKVQKFQQDASYPNTNKRNYSLGK